MTLTLRRDPDHSPRGEYFLVYDESGTRVGRIFNSFPDLEQAKGWFWGLDFFEARGARPFYGHEATRELAMEMFKQAWNSRPPAARDPA